MKKLFTNLCLCSMMALTLSNVQAFAGDDVCTKCDCAKKCDCECHKVIKKCDCNSNCDCDCCKNGDCKCKEQNCECIKNTDCQHKQNCDCKKMKKVKKSK